MFFFVQANCRLNSQQFEVDNMTSQKNTLQATLEEKILKLESENKKKEEHLCKVCFSFFSGVKTI